MSAPLPDYYAILHVDPAAPTEVIRASYRTLMQRLGAHPDLGGDHESAAALNAAYAVLKDSQRRAQYDAQRRAPGGEARPQPGAASAQRPSQPREPREHSADCNPEQNGSTGIWVNDTGTGGRVAVCPFCGVAASGGRHVTESSSQCRACSAPLTLVRRVGGDGSEGSQRSVYRIAKAQSLRVYKDPGDRSGIDALVHDISLSGMRFSCAFVFDTGDLIRADCDICSAVARVAHVSRDSNGMNQFGAEFLTVQFKRQRGSLLSVPA